MPTAPIPPPLTVPPLKTGEESVYRQHPYLPVEIVRFSGMNPDASDVARGPGAFKELHNMRFETSGTPTTRTGTQTFRTAKTDVTGSLRPIASCEYIVWHSSGDGSQTEYRFHAALVWQATAQTVVLKLTDKRLRDGTGATVTIATGITAAGDGTPPRGCIRQYGSYVIISLFDHASYIAWPTGFPITSGTTWSVEVLGKDVCPMPAYYNFAETLTGDLIVFSAHADDNHVMQYDTVSDADPTPVELRLPIEAMYWRAGGAVFNLRASSANFGVSDETIDEAKIVATDIIPRWLASKKDGGPSVGNEGAGGVTHLMHRGYFYRFVFLRTLTLPDGTKVKLRSNPSSDLFVPAVVYAPFFWFDPQSGAAQHTHKGFPQSINDNQPIGWRQNAPVFNSVDVPSPIPDLKAMTDLQALYRGYFKDGTDANARGGTGGPLHWVSHWLGWCSQSDFVVWAGQPPYKCDATAEDVTGAPQTVFEWSAFDITDGAVDEIEVYRTAYEDVDPEKRPVSTPLFGPHIYGLVGSIERDGTFTDTTKIPDFGVDPSRYDGYLRGEFSGDKEFDYGQSPALVFGNVRVDYRLLTPTPLVQAATTFFEKETRYGQQYNPPYSAFAATALDHEKMIRFSYCYEDRLGYRSAAVEVPTASAPDGPFAVLNSGLAVRFTFPYGYEPSIKKIILFRSIWSDGPTWTGAAGQDPAGSRVLTEIAAIKPEPGTYISGGDEVGTAVPASYPAGDYAKFYEPGAIIYSLPDEPWDWPQSQVEKHHSSAPVRHLGDLMGELAVVTDESFTLTLLRAQAPRSERETSWLGCISKDAAAKIEDVEVVLSQHGVYFLTPSRPEKLPDHVKVELISYMTETISNTLSLANLRRASMGYLDRRKELWLHIPSSIDLWPPITNADGSTAPNPAARPQRTYIFKFGASIREMDNYTFDIDPNFEIRNYVDEDDKPPGPPRVDIGTFNAANVLFSAGSDGGLWATYMDTSADTAGDLIVLDCDVPSVDFPCAGYGALVLGQEEPSGQKQLERVELLMQARGKVQIVTGISKPAIGGATSGGESVLAGWDAVWGHIHNRARVWTFRKIVADQPRKYNHPCGEIALETKGSTVMVRVRTTPDDTGRHSVTLNGLTIYYDQKHQHG